MTKTYVANKLVCFRIDGVTIFQGFKNGVTTKLMQEPCSIREWCALYGTLHKSSYPNFEQFEWWEKSKVCLHLCTITLPTVLSAILR
jgi:hypothetical protein